MNRALLHLAVLAGVLLVACPAPPSVPEPVEPAEPRVPPDPHAERTVLPTPEGPWEGQGRTWIEKVGASPRDYPGPAALVSVARAVPGGLTLAPDVRADGFDGCAGGGGEDWMGAAAVLPIGDGGGCAGLAACTEALDRLLEQRVSLVAALGGSDEVADALARHTRTRVGRTKVRQHFAVTLPSRLAPGIGARLGDAHAGVIRTGAFLLAERRELMLLNRTVRASGRRVLLGFPFGRASEAGSDRELALLGMHLASGGGLWVEGGARLPDRLERARAALRRRPELVHRSDARVGVLVDPGELEASALVELTGTLEAVRIPWDVVLQPTEAGWPDQHEGERVSAYAALALPRAALLSEELVGLLAGASSPRWILLRPSDPAAPAARERLDAAGIPHVTVGKGMSGVVSLPEELGWVITDLPAPVWVGRTKAPPSGPRGASLRQPGARPARALGPGRRLDARASGGRSGGRGTLRGRVAGARRRPAAGGSVPGRPPR